VQLFTGRAVVRGEKFQRGGLEVSKKKKLKFASVSSPKICMISCHQNTTSGKKQENEKREKGADFFLLFFCFFPSSLSLPFLLQLFPLAKSLTNQCKDAHFPQIQSASCKHLPRTTTARLIIHLTFQMSNKNIE